MSIKRLVIGLVLIAAGVAGIASGASSMVAVLGSAFAAIAGVMQVHKAFN